MKLTLEIALLFSTWSVLIAGLLLAELLRMRRASKRLARMTAVEIAPVIGL